MPVINVYENFNRPYIGPNAFDRPDENNLIFAFKLEHIQAICPRFNFNDPGEDGYHIDFIISPDSIKSILPDTDRPFGIRKYYPSKEKMDEDLKKPGIGII